MGTTFSHGGPRSDRELVQAVARGIEDCRSTQLQTVELNYLVSSSLDDESWRRSSRWTRLYLRTDVCGAPEEYNRRAFLPTVMVEANYEFEAWHYPTDLRTLRRQAYWSMLSGASGQFYGNEYTWQFLDDWQDHLDTPGSRQMMYAARLFASRPWFRLVPDERHQVVTTVRHVLRGGILNDNATSPRRTLSTTV